ncbi:MULTISPECIES: hypothetical protein [unclassified Pedobacter]|uniref:hypothetical protein n=1 Tax=unclassified Pedobacter TaxID=2628915 RepID=UPI000B4AE639|nr:MULTISPECIES: hypothetical protein [unclassified Pedobacter]MCX2586547.1 hypothetical protein [Pedobacter sp. MR22-3]OWK68694.1 hypothetical protein CBW18_20815 [Pedobacter sp. AJM]
MRTTFALLLISLLGISTHIQAQTSLTANNSFISIQKLADTRINFNKILIKSRHIQAANLPQSKYIFNHPGLHRVNIEGLNFVVKNNAIIAIEEFILSKAALNMINDRLMVLDKMQYAYSESSNQGYLEGEKNTSLAFNNDRQFFSVLKNLKDTLKEISKMANDHQNTASVELSLAKWKQPKIDWEFYCQIVERETKSQLSK